MTVWSALAANLLAQGSVIQQEEEPKGYVLSYMIVMLGVGLGLLVICRTGKRTTHFRHDD